MKKIEKFFRRGETILEVSLAIVIFTSVSIIAINLMNSGNSIAQSALELSMARNEIDAQAEAIRFIHNSFLAERELKTSDQEYRKLWLKLTRDPLDTSSPGLTNLPDKIANFNLIACEKAYQDNISDPTQSSVFQNHGFVINTRLIAPSSIDQNFLNQYFGNNPSSPNVYEKLIPEVIISSSDIANKHKFKPSSLYPRLVFSKNSSANKNSDNELLEIDDYRSVNSVEGIWVLSVRDTTKGPGSTPEFFDFHIRTCWYPPGRKIASTIGTIIRLYNPEAIEGVRP